MCQEEPAAEREQALAEAKELLRAAEAELEGRALAEGCDQHQACKCSGCCPDLKGFANF